MARVELKGISKIFDSNVMAVDNADFVVEDREFVVILGPSGCGKSTTLRMVAGLEEITEGELYIDGELMNDVPPKDRNIAMVFQNYALYPHMTVYENMAFGLRIKKLDRKEIDQRIQEAARILDIEKHLMRKPRALSGGQRQRVAVGRAIVRNPKVFLFDEPLSNLDAKLRVQMRAELYDLHLRLNATIIYVTHDQVEAMSMADKIVVMKDGKIQQIGAPLHLYNQPANKFVAGFIGSPQMNFLTVKVMEENGLFLDEGNFKLKPAFEHLEFLKNYLDREILLGIRSEDLNYIRTDLSSESALADEISAGRKNIIPGKIDLVEPLGADTHLWLSTASHSIVARTEAHEKFKAGDSVYFCPKMEKARYFEKETELSIN